MNNDITSAQLEEYRKSGFPFGYLIAWPFVLTSWVLVMVLSVRLVGSEWSTLTFLIASTVVNQAYREPNNFSKLRGWSLFVLRWLMIVLVGILSVKRLGVFERP